MVRTTRPHRIAEPASPKFDGVAPHFGLGRGLAAAAALLALGLLIGFYSVVSGIVSRAAAGREHLRVEAERQVICSAFSSVSSRDLCLLTVAAHATGNRGAREPWRQASVGLARKVEYTASVR